MHNRLLSSLVTQCLISCIIGLYQDKNSGFSLLNMHCYFSFFSMHLSLSLHWHLVSAKCIIYLHLLHPSLYMVSLLNMYHCFYFWACICPFVFTFKHAHVHSCEVDADLFLLGPHYKGFHVPKIWWLSTQIWSPITLNRVVKYINIINNTLAPL